MSQFLLTHEFEELSLFTGYDFDQQPVEAMAIASGKAAITTDGHGWNVTALWLDPKWSKPGQPTEYSVPLRSPLGALLVIAIEKHCEGEIEDAIREHQESDRYDAAEYAGEMRRDDAMLQRAGL